MYRLLIVDDEAPIRNGLSAIIPWNQMGYSLIGAVGSGGEALEIITSEKVDVLLTDIQMPGLSGLQLCEAVKEVSPHTEIVIISGYDRFDYAVTALKLQVGDYVLKPIKPEEIRQVFTKLAQRLNARCQLQKSQRRSLYAENEYGMLRLIGDELQDLEKFWQYFKGSDSLRLILIWHLQGDSQEGFWSSLHEVLDDLFCINTDGLYALFLPGTKLEETLGCLQGLIQRDQIHSGDCKIIVSQEIYHVLDIYQVFFDTTEHMENARAGEVVFARPLADSDLRKTGFAKVRTELLEALEQGDREQISAGVEDLEKQVQNRNTLHIRMVYSNLLLTIARYFQMEDIHGFSLLQPHGQEAESGEELACRLKRDLILALERLREGADTSTLLVQRARKEIEKNYTDADFMLTGIADALHVNYNYLSTVFSKETGTSLKSCLTSIRMERARQLILQRNHKMYQIAEMVGYNNPRYFADAFRKHFGTSPKEYVQSLGGRGHEA